MKELVDEKCIKIVPMTPKMYHIYFMEYENDPDLCLDGQEYIPYIFSEEKVKQYVEKQINLKRLSFAIMFDDEIAGEIILKNIDDKSVTMSISLKNAKYKNRGIGTIAEKLVVSYVFDELDIPTIFADTVKTNIRSQHVLEKVGFNLINEDDNYKYYRIDR